MNALVEFGNPLYRRGGGECVSNLLETAVAISVGYKGVRSAE